MMVKYHLFKKRVPMMNAALDAYALRQKVIAKNVANINTPHYKPESVKFEEFLRRDQLALKGSTTDTGHFRIGAGSGDKAPEAETYYDSVPEAEIFHSGENHVNIDKEMVELAENQIRARFASQMIGKYFRGLGSAITGQASNP